MNQKGRWWRLLLGIGILIIGCIIVAMASFDLTKF